MQDEILLSIIYAVLAFVLVSYSGTYNLTYKIYNKITPTSQYTYGQGNSFSAPGFWLHILVFTLLIAVPMLYVKKQSG
jgi:hypothetical protein